MRVIVVVGGLGEAMLDERMISALPIDDSPDGLTPFRGQQVRESCTICRTLTEVSCLRCATPFCESHAPRKNRRCGECEVEYKSVTQTGVIESIASPGRRTFAGSLAGMVGIVLLLSGGSHLTVAVCAVVCIVSASEGMGAHARMREARRKFLAETIRQGAGTELTKQRYLAAPEWPE